MMLPKPMMTTLSKVERERYLALEKRNPFVKGQGAVASLDSIGPRLYALLQKQEEAAQLTRILWKKYLAACIAHGIEPQTGPILG